MLDALPTLSVEILTRADWVFGPARDERRWSAIRFGPSGRIEGYQHPNEASWDCGDGRLRILREDGEVMWEAGPCSVQDGRLRTTLTPVADPSVEPFTLCERVSGEDVSAETSGGAELAVLSPADFLFPRELQVTPTPVTKVLMIGSCLAQALAHQLRAAYPGTSFDLLIFNNVDILPDDPPSPVGEYQFCYVQMALRNVITDRVIEAVRLNDPAFVDAVLADGFERLDQMLEAALLYNRVHGLTAFVANFMVPQTNTVASLDRRGTRHDLARIVRAYNDHLAEAVRRHPNAFLLDVDGLGASLGKRLFLDDALSFSTHGSVLREEEYDMRPHARIEPVPPMDSFYETRTTTFYQMVFEQALASYRTVRQIDQVKAVIFDLDHTLWRGQIAEDWLDGREHRPPLSEWMVGLWDAVQQLRARGILVAVCSKNDLDVVRDNWDNVVSPRFLGLEDFASVKINWLPKPENIRDVLAEFNIKARSAVFVDDNPVERAQVRAAFPEMRCIGSNPYLTRRILLWSPETQVAQLTSESMGREGAIRGQIVREETRGALNRTEFLHTLESRVTFVDVTEPGQAEFVRVLELTNRTNQFNTTGRRWTHAELQAFIGGGGKVTGFLVHDRFAKYGLMGVLYVEGNSIVQMVMSCRVLGMEIETCAVAHAVAHIRAQGDQPDVFAELVETRDNGPCRQVFHRAGFAEGQRDGDTRRYELSFGRPVPATPHIIVLGEQVLVPA